MRILAIKASVPFPLEQGTNYVSYSLLEALAKEHDVTFLTLAKGSADFEALQQIRKICPKTYHVVAPNSLSLWHRGWYKLINGLRAMLTGQPTSVFYQVPPELRRKARQLSEQQPFDLCYVEYAFAASIIKDIRATVKVLVKHDVDFVTAARAVQHAKGALTRWRWQVKVSSLLRLEIETARWFDHVLTLSSEDRRQTLQHGMHHSVHVLPTSYRFFEGTVPPLPAVSSQATFVGAMSAHFNHDAVMYCLNEIWPHIRQQIPEASFLVAGKGPSAELLSRDGRDGVRVVGWVPSMYPIYEQTAVVLCPIRVGSGIKVKVLEAMAYGRPIVTTSVGVEGIDGIEHGVHLLVCDTPRDFADAACRLMRDPGMRARLGAHARQFFENHFSTKASEPVILDLFRSLQRPR